MAGRFVVVDGNNGTGKSTVAAHLRDRLDAALFHYPDAFVRFRADARLDSAIGPEARLHYYLGATLHLSELVDAELSAGRNVVCDRYLAAPMSLLVAEAALPAGSVEAVAAPIAERILRADMTLLLLARHDVAAERLRGRLGVLPDVSMTAVERRSTVSSEFFARRESALRRFASMTGPVVEVDTSDLDIEPMCRVAWDAARGTVSA